MAECCLLPDRSILAVKGPEARDFLQGIITNDIRKLEEGKPLFTAMLTPQGKFLFEFFLIAYQDYLLIEIDRDRLQDLIARLTMYRLRAKVEFEEQIQWAVAAIWDDYRVKSVDYGIIYPDPRAYKMGKRLIYSRGNSTIPEEVTTHPAMHDRHRIDRGVPEGGKDLIVEKSFPLEFGYDRMDIIDFNKGCYVGQEVTARTKHRGTLHKYVHCVEGDGPLPPAGTPILSNARSIGEMCSSNGKYGFALVRTADAAAAKFLTANDVPVRMKLPHWFAS